MREFNYKCNEVLEMGYFEAWRLWFILDELKARDQYYESLTQHMYSSNDDHVQNILHWLEDRRPRYMNQKKQNEIPREVLEKFGEAWKRGRRQ